MPKRPTSAASASLKPSSAHFDPWSSPTPGKAVVPPIEETWSHEAEPCPR